MTTCLIFTDASDEGYACFILKHLNKEVFVLQNSKTVKNKQVNT